MVYLLQVWVWENSISEGGGRLCHWILCKIRLKRAPFQEVEMNFIGQRSDRAVILEEKESPVIYGLDERQINK